jgi:hypothetical protein
VRLPYLYYLLQFQWHLVTPLCAAFHRRPSDRLGVATGTGTFDIKGSAKPTQQFNWVLSAAVHISIIDMLYAAVIYHPPLVFRSCCYYGGGGVTT